MSNGHQNRKKLRISPSTKPNTCLRGTTAATTTPKMKPHIDKRPCLGDALERKNTQSLIQKILQTRGFQHTGMHPKVAIRQTTNTQEHQSIDREQKTTPTTIAGSVTPEGIPKVNTHKQRGTKQYTPPLTFTTIKNMKIKMEANPREHKPWI